MKVLITTDLYTTKTNGVVTSVRNLMEELTKKGHETQGLTYVEAAANGLPLLCRRDPCLDGVLIEGKNGWEYEAGEEFCGIIDAILENPHWCRAAGDQSQQIAATFDKSNFAEKIEDIYEAIRP